MGRAPCCDKAKVKKGPWSPEEDATLKAYIEQNGTGGNWIALPQKIGLKRCGKSCRLRWLNYLRPNIKHGGFSEEEDNIICSLYISIGSRLKKKLLGKQRKEQAAAAKRASLKPQILKTESDHSLMVPGGGMIMNNQTQYYWPELTAVTMPPGGGLVNQTQLDPNFKDQESLKNFLIKLQGGRFSDYHHQLSNTTTATANNVQYPFDVSFSQDQEQLYDSTITTMLASPPTSMNSMNSSTTASRLQDTHEYNIIGANMIINQGLENYPIEPSHDDHLIYNNNQPQRLDIINGVESFYGMDQMINNNGSTGTTSTSAESNSWEDISSLVYPNSMVPHDYEICQQHSTFEQPAYLFGHQ
ncbi:hypothetical protein EZV62_014555 [Acer yangbiense]|uniref:Uncharacterized protein n=1 Tax=Acer yangbiense TaxID=1000413 RepID=A0A5C7HUZ2_9ROSI|nr:hypothetical protein EZV62_014555 [Acer yangbiense]